MLEYNLSIDNKLSRLWFVNFSIENKWTRSREMFENKLWNVSTEKMTLKQMLEHNLSIDNKLSRLWFVNFPIENNWSRSREMLSIENKLWNVNLSIENKLPR